MQQQCLHAFLQLTVAVTQHAFLRRIMENHCLKAEMSFRQYHILISIIEVCRRSLPQTPLSGLLSRQLHLRHEKRLCTGRTRIDRIASLFHHKLPAYYIVETEFLCRNHKFHPAAFSRRHILQAPECQQLPQRFLHAGSRRRPVDLYHFIPGRTAYILHLQGNMQHRAVLQRHRQIRIGKLRIA